MFSTGSHICLPRPCPKQCQDGVACSQRLSFSHFYSNIGMMEETWSPSLVEIRGQWMIMVDLGN